MKDLTVEDVRAEFARRFGELKPEARSSFRQRFLVHDYETYKSDCLLVTLEPATGRVWTHWGVEPIRNFLREMLVNNESSVFVGYNNKKFDNRISDGILDGMTVRDVKDLSDQLIGGDEENLHWRSGTRGKPDWVGRTFDIGFDIGQKKIGTPPNERKIPEVSLKRWERLNGYKVHRCSVPFDKPALTARDKREIEKYCFYDVCATAMVVLSDEGWDPCLNARRVLVDEYADKGVNWEMTKPRITAIVLNAREENYEVPEWWEKEFYVAPPCIRIRKNADVFQAYTNNSFGDLREMSNKKSGGKGVLNKLVCGIPHNYGVGGVHGCMPGIWQCYDGGIWSLDAASLYPNIMRHHGFLSRRVVGEDRERFANLIDLRTKVYKPAGDKRAEGLKLVLNGGFGSMGFDKSEMYDPVCFSSVTISGQLFITDLLEKLERHIELIQSNTDGIFFRFRDKSGAGMAECREIVAAFEKRTKLEMEWTEFERMYQRDVSTYVAREVPKPGKPAGSGKLKKKSSYYGFKHCTVQPYFFEARVHAALNNGERLSTEGYDIDRFSIDVKRDKNSEAFVIGGKPDAREWLEVVPVPHGSAKATPIAVLCKDDGKMGDSIFGDLGDDLAFRKRRKATGCPEFAALAENAEIGDIDLAWYEKDSAPAAEDETFDSPDLSF